MCVCAYVPICSFRIRFVFFFFFFLCAFFLLLHYLEYFQRVVQSDWYVYFNFITLVYQAEQQFDGVSGETNDVD